uniref:NADH-ubiquinone oxidoreductase chain 3 n=2 Tax=Polistes TaxID=7456 RepID=B4XEN7_9HYME|nr:NADH dehydrogenase subunit 3 [Polistes sp. MD1]
MIMMMLFLIPIFLTMILFLINLISQIKIFKDREKPSPYECGFNPLTSSRLPFSIQFFLIALIFLIFDIEIILLFPLIPSILKNNNFFYWIFNMLIIYLCLVIGLIYEWNEQSIIWIK